MGKIIAKWYEWAAKRKWLLYSTLSIAIVGLFFGIQRLHITQDIISTIRGGEQFDEYSELLQKKGLNQELLISLQKPDSLSFEDLQEEGTSFIQATQRRYPELFDQLSHEAPDFEEIYTFYYDQLALQLDPRAIPDSTLQADAVANQIRQNHSKLFTPEGVFLKKFLFRDPLNWMTGVLETQRTKIGGNAIEVIAGSFALNDSSFVIRAKLSEHFLEADDKLDQLAELETWLTAYSHNSQIQTDYFTPSRIALENARQVKRDTLLTLLVSLSIILFLLFFYYRKVSIPFFFLLPGAFGVLFSLGIIGWLNPQITGLALGAGAVVIGIIMDYSFHFFTHLKHTGSIKETLEEVAHPLLIGCLTTVMAFGALLFANSVILHDFGLFAALSLVGTAIGVLILLPLFLPAKWVHQFAQTKKEEKADKQSFRIPGKWGLLITVAATIFALFGISDVRFEDDLDQLNYYPAHIQSAEEKFTGFVSGDDKRMFVAVKGNTLEDALRKSENLEQVLAHEQQENRVKDYLSVSAYLLSANELNNRWEEWRAFWEARQPALFVQLDALSDELGYTQIAFAQFKKTLEEKPEHIQHQDYSFVQDIYSRLVDEQADQVSVLTVVTASKNELDDLKFTLGQHADFVLLDRSDLAAKMVETVEEDFNYILWVSSGLVFLILLINFGRMELTLITFFPMILSWIWILGFAGWMGIHFNLINVVVTTFIFGLGDDFAIFVTEGKLAKFVSGKKSLGSFTTGIVLSAITTIVGTGVLVLAEHPAIHSIGLISIVGLLSILFISLVVQPLLFDFFISGRTEKGRAPLTLSGFLISLFAFTFFLVGCTIIFVILLVFKLIPFGQKKLKLTMHYILKWFTWAQVYVMVNVKKEIVNRELLDYSKPALVIANHQSFIDILVMIMLNPKVVIMTNKWVYNSPFFGAAVRYADYLPASEGYENLMEKMRELVADGYSIMVFPEGTRSKTEEIGRFHKGAFYLAEELGLDIQPILLHGFHFTMSKSDFLLKNGILTIQPLPRIHKDDLSYGETYAERTKKISRYFKQEYAALQKRRKNPEYIGRQLLYNYLFKSPIIEWYFRIKYRLEKQHYAEYNELIGDRKRIYDLGCGLGFLSYYLKSAQPGRRITGLDYDEDKITVAQNCYQKDAHIDFLAGDVTQFIPEQADAVLLMDILHYLSEAEQLQVLENAVNNLNPNGVILIRDGITDDSEKFIATQQTENWSIRILGFNKSEQALNFFHSDFIQKFSETHQLSFDMRPHSDKTTNHLFILKKL
jgi:uncharacterized protein